MKGAFLLKSMPRIRHIVTTYLYVEAICLGAKMKQAPENLFRKHGGQLRMSEAIVR